MALPRDNQDENLLGLGILFWRQELRPIIEAVVPMFLKDGRNWTEFRKLPGVMEVDFHWVGEESEGSYRANMEAVRRRALSALVEAQQKGMRFVLFTHGHSTSRQGATTSRSQVRSLMRSKEATPYIQRGQCIQHYAVFVAAIRPLPGGLVSSA